MDELIKKLPAGAKASDYIHDFVNSTDKRFEGKSKKERIRMALGAYYGRGKRAYSPQEVELQKRLVALQRGNSVLKAALAALRG